MKEITLELKDGPYDFAVYMGMYNGILVLVSIDKKAGTVNVYDNKCLKLSERNKILNRIQSLLEEAMEFLVSLPETVTINLSTHPANLKDALEIKSHFCLFDETITIRQYFGHLVLDKILYAQHHRPGWYIEMESVLIARGFIPQPTSQQEKDDIVKEMIKYL